MMTTGNVSVLMQQGQVNNRVKDPPEILGGHKSQVLAVGFNQSTETHRLYNGSMCLLYNIII